MTKWLYGTDLIERGMLDDKLDQWGELGWELVSFTPEASVDKLMFRLIFKRPDDSTDDVISDDEQ